MVLTCHWTVGVGVPLAAATKLAVDPKLTDAFVGCWVTLGAARVFNGPVKFPLPVARNTAIVPQS